MTIAVLTVALLVALLYHPDRIIPPPFPIRSNTVPRFVIRERTAEGDNFRYGYIDDTGSTAIPVEFEEARDFQETFAAVKKDGLWGIIDEQGERLMKPEYAESLGFSEALCAVYTPEGAGYIDYEGTWRIAPKFDRARSFHEGLAAVGKQDFSDPRASFLGPWYWGYIRRDGSYLVAPSEGYKEAGDFSGGLARVGEIPLFDYRIQHAYIDRRGRKFTPPTGKSLLPLGPSKRKALPEEWLFPVRAVENGKVVYRMLDAKGRVGLTVENPPVGSFSEGLCGFRRQSDGLGGYFDEQGHTVIAPAYEAVGRFKGGRTFVAPKESAEVQVVDGKTVQFGHQLLIDCTGRIVTEEKFVTPTEFHADRAFVRSNKEGDLFMIDQEGKHLTEEIIEEVLVPFRDGLCRVQIDGGWAYINLKGEVVWREDGPPVQHPQSISSPGLGVSR